MKKIAIPENCHHCIYTFQADLKNGIILQPKLIKYLVVDGPLLNNSNWKKTYFWKIKKCFAI